MSLIRDSISECNAIIGEQDRLLERYTRALERISAIANGSRAVRGQFAELMQEAIDIADAALED